MELTFCNGFWCLIHCCPFPFLFFLFFIPITVSLISHLILTASVNIVVFLDLLLRDQIIALLNLVEPASYDAYHGGWSWAWIRCWCRWSWCRLNWCPCFCLRLLLCGDFCRSITSLLLVLGLKRSSLERAYSTFCSAFKAAAEALKSIFGP